MSHKFRLIAWDRFKVRYDLAVVVACVIFIAVYIGASVIAGDATTTAGPEVLALRVSGSLAIVLLHVILAIGPAARLMPGLLPLLYNRRHLGVMTFFVALFHGLLATVYYHGFGNVFPLTSLARGVEQTISLGTLPFQLFGVGGLLIMLLLALTSHDFWLKLLTPKWWKRLHVYVYLAYALLIAHVLLGAIQQEKSPLLGALIGVGFASIVGLHIAARLNRKRGPIVNPALRSQDDAWLEVPSALAIAPGEGTVVHAPTGTKIAIFRHEDRLLAISNRCAHQGGPLGEGAIVDGCVTCPWHGHQFDPASGCAPSPYTDRVPTHAMRVEAGRVEVRISASPLGTVQDGVGVAALSQTLAAKEHQRSREFFVGYLPMDAASRRGLLALVVSLVGIIGFVGAIASASRRPAGPAVWDTQTLETIEGRVVALPYPHVVLDAPSLGVSAGSSVLVVEEGKHGAARLASLDGTRVRLRGYSLRRGDWRMLELMPGDAAIETLDPSVPSASIAPVAAATEVVLQGEIVDSKCFLGAMRPGDGLVHRACAILCVQGGVPPVLVISQGSQIDPRLALTNMDAAIVMERDGSPLSERYQNLIGVAVEVRGQLTQVGGLPRLALRSVKPLAAWRGATDGQGVAQDGPRHRTPWPEVCGGR